MAKTARREGPVRYAVVGLGHIAQVAALPAFAQARRNSKLEALISDDPVKLKALGRKCRRSTSRRRRASSSRSRHTRHPSGRRPGSASRDHQ